MFEPSCNVAESASYTSILEALAQFCIRDRADADDSMSASCCKPNLGRFSNVEGTDSETACGNREASYAE